MHTDRLARGCQEQEQEEVEEKEKCLEEEIRWRRADGKCNNLESPERGSSHTAYRRLLAPAYSDSHTMREGSDIFLCIRIILVAQSCPKLSQFEGIEPLS